MDSSAIEAIASLAIAKAAKNDDYLVTHVNQKLHPLESFAGQPSRFRGKFATNSLDDFIRYLTTNADEDTGLYIDYLNGSASAIIDQGEPKDPYWGSHTAKLSLIKTPDYAEVLRLDGERLKQQDLIDFVEDYPACFQFLDNDLTPVPDNKAVLGILRKVKVSNNKATESNIGNFASSATAMEQIEMRAAGNESLPAGFNFKCTPYDGFDFYILACQLRAITDGESVAFKYRIIGLENAQKAIATELHQRIKKGTESIEGLKLYLGDMAYPA